MEERPTNAVHPTDTELVPDARHGDTAAFEALTARHFPMVYVLAYARLGARQPQLCPAVAKAVGRL